MRNNIIIKKYLIPLIVFLLLGFAIMLPVLKNIDYNIFGHILPESNTILRKKIYYDGYQHIWNFWWAKKTCLGLCGNFWETNYLFWPNGTGLYFHNFSFPNLILFAPIISLGLSAIASYNLSFWISITLSGYFMYLLVLYLTKSSRASVLSGIFFGMSPYIIGHMIDGQLDHASVQFFPLFMLFLFKTKDNDNRAYPIVAGLILFILGTNFSHLVVALFVFAIFSIFYFLYSKNKIPYTKKIFLVAVSFIIPFVLFFNQNILNIKKYEVGGDTRWTSEFFSTDLESIFIPPETSYIGNKFFSNTHFDYVGINSDNNSFIGYSVILLALASLAITKRDKIKFWWIILVSSFVLILGPKLHFGSQVILSWMPYKIIEALPVFNIFRTPSRFGVLVYLSLAVIIAFAFASFEKKKPYFSKYLFVILIVMVMIEFFPIKILTSKQYLPGAYKVIQALDDNSPVLEYPFLWASGLDTIEPYTPVYMYYQTEHGKPILGGYLTRLENNVYDSYKKTPSLEYFRAEERRSRLDTDFLDIIKRYSDDSLVESLKKSEFKYFVINKNYPSGAQEKILSEAKNSFDLIFEDGSSQLFKIR